MSEKTMTVLHNFGTEEDPDNVYITFSVKLEACKTLFMGFPVTPLIRRVALSELESLLLQKFRTTIANTYYH